MAFAGNLAAVTCVVDLVEWLEHRYPPAWAADWDRVGLVLGEPSAEVHRVLLAVDCVPETAEEALANRADLLITHHPLLLRGVSSVAPVTYKGRIVHRMISQGAALYVAHTNADVAAPGVSDALAHRLGLTDLRPLRPADGVAAGAGRGSGRVGSLAGSMSLAEFATVAARRLPETQWGVRAAGDPDRTISTVAVCGGAGDTYLEDARRAGADVYLTADLRHHPASEYVSAGGPALLDAAHWATERPWLDELAGALRTGTGVEVIVSDLVTDPWTIHRSEMKEQQP
jgi:dinuclear metal center YbgI/SA1388 family protein